jgi:NAD(P)-dependent dehydrogenase (short-subunit alcohol dehydrogenase family)
LRIRSGITGENKMANCDTLFDIGGKNVIVTGASSGLGVAFAAILAERGANVTLAARRTERLTRVAEKIAASGGTAFPLTCDVTDTEQVKTMVDAAVHRFGRVDILVNNAGVVDIGMPEKVPNEAFERTVKVNLLGTWYCCQAAGKRMLADGKGGSIINITSSAGLNGQQDFPVAYQATKAAIINLTRNLASSWGDRGVRVNAIAPGWFPSEMTESWFAAPAFLEHVKKMSPLGRIGAPSDLTGALLLLASDASSFITGHTLVVDGGASTSMGLPFMTADLFKLMAGLPGELGQRIMPS